MEEITNAISNWDAIRNNSEQLKQIFKNRSGFSFDNTLFPQNVPLHAYAAIKNNVFGFYLISEQYDVASPVSILTNNIFWCPCIIIANGEEQDIPESVALARVDAWRNNYEEWIDQVVKSTFGMYQTFYIPIISLNSQTYTASFALKYDPENPANIIADLVLSDDLGAYYDTVMAEPPFKDPHKYYILNLI